MRRLLKILGLVALILMILYMGNRLLLSGRSAYQSLYLVPANAAWIIESDEPFDAWNRIIHSDAWHTLSQIEVFKELNKDILEMDSVFNEQIVLIKAIGKYKSMISAHEVVPGKFDYLYILNLGKITRLRNPEKIISTFLGNEYPITKRAFNKQVIYEMHDRKSGELYIFCFVHDKIVFSTTYKLVESALTEMDKMTLGRDLSFIDVSKRITGKGLFSLYINYDYFPGYLRWMLGKSSEQIEGLKKELRYSAFSFDISSDGLISLEGYTGVNDSVASFYSSILTAGSGGFTTVDLIPSRVASMVKISFDDASDYYNNSLINLSPKELEEFKNTKDKIEKRLKISVDDNLLSWIDNEIILLQAKPSNLGRKNEFAAIIKAKDSHNARLNLEFLAKQIKRNSPVKVKEVVYEDRMIYYISFPGLIKALFGRMLEKIERPYYTLIDNYVIFSNHPQTLKNIIDDYNAKKTLRYSDSYKQFIQAFDRKNTSLIYLDIPVLFSNLEEYTSTATWQKLKSNKSYITSFSHAGVQIDSKDELLHLKVYTQYSQKIEDYSKALFDESFLNQFSLPDTMTPETSVSAWYDPEIVINDLDDKQMEVRDDGNNLLYSIELKNGIKHGTYKAFFPDGSVRVTGKFKNDLRQGPWKLFNEDGKVTEEKVFEEGFELPEKE
jgi:hypothetical protein